MYGAGKSYACMPRAKHVRSAAEGFSSSGSGQENTASKWLRCAGCHWMSNCTSRCLFAFDAIVFSHVSMIRTLFKLSIKSQTQAHRPLQYMVARHLRVESQGSRATGHWHSEMMICTRSTMLAVACARSHCEKKRGYRMRNKQICSAA